MTDQGQRLRSFSTPFVRALAALGFVIIFFVSASIIEPGPSTASTVTPVLPSTQNGRASGVDRPVSLGSLLGPQYSTYILDTADGPRYTVYNGSGDILVHKATADEVYQVLPDYNVLDLNAGALGDVDPLDVNPEW